MAKRKYNIYDDNGETIGFVVIEINPTFEQSVSAAIPGDGPIADAALFLAVLGGFTGAAWLLPGPAWLPPVVGISITAALAGIKAWRGSLVSHNEPKSDELTIKLESWSDEGRRVLLDEVQDKTINLDDWRKVAKAVIRDEVNFSRPALAGYVTQTTWHKVKDELTRLNMAHRQGNSYTLSPRGLAFLRKVEKLPY